MKLRQKLGRIIMPFLISASIFVILLLKSTFPVRSGWQLPELIFYSSQSQIFTAYLPIVLTNPILVEVDAPPCRWSNTTIDFKWGNLLQTPGSVWRNAFEAAITDWNIAPTRFYFWLSSNGTTIFNIYSANDGYGGFAQPYCNGTLTVKYEVYGNAYYTYTTNGYHAIAGHEIGHSQGIGHLSNPIVALMGNNPNPEVYYTPQLVDINFVNQIYP